MKHFVALLLLAAPLQAQLEVASLHPLVGGLAREIGGDRVEVVDIAKPGFKPHRFEPTARDLAALDSSELVLASGKGLERYLDDLRDSLGETPLVEVGAGIPSRNLEGDEIHCSDCGHDHGEIDPHWWHDVSNMERAAKIVGEALGEADPDSAEYYADRSKELRRRLSKLDAWVRAELAKVPRAQRQLVTAHAAFGYFCEAYRFEPVYLLGLSGDHEVPARELAEQVERLRDRGVRAVFPERFNNPKVLARIAEECGATLGEPLIADGAVADYEAMMKGNVLAIVGALGQ